MKAEEFVELIKNRSLYNKDIMLIIHVDSSGNLVIKNISNLKNITQDTMNTDESKKDSCFLKRSQIIVQPFNQDDVSIFSQEESIIDKIEYNNLSNRLSKTKDIEIIDNIWNMLKTKNTKIKGMPSSYDELFHKRVYQRRWYLLNK